MTNKIFMCPPDYFYSINYEINPWMTKGTQCNNEAAIKTWDNLKNQITELGAEVLTMQAQPDLPDIVFTANAALIHKNTAVVSRFRYAERQPEEKFYAEWLKAQGFKLEILPEDMFFEGAGDALFSGDTLYAGYVPRTDISSHTYLSSLLGIKTISMELVNKSYYHLDTCFCPLSDGYLMYYPDAFDEYANQIIEKNFPEEKRIPVTAEEAAKFSCNAVNVGRNVIMNVTTARLKNALDEKGFKSFEFDFTEFMKAGGSAKCLTLKLC